MLRFSLFMNIRLVWIFFKRETNELIKNDKARVLPMIIFCSMALSPTAKHNKNSLPVAKVNLVHHSKYYSWLA